jgi:hypothetical protein
MTTEYFALEFPQRVSLLLDQRSQLLDSLILANHKLDEKADRSIQTASIVIGLGSVVAALPSDGLVSFGAQATNILTYGQISLTIVSIFAFVILVLFAQQVNRPVTWKGSGDTDWKNNSMRYLNTHSYDILLADLLETIDSVKTLNERKANYVIRINWCLTVVVITMAISLLLGVISSSY